MAMMKMEPGFMGRAKRKAKRMSPEQMKFLQELGQKNMLDQQQEAGMQDKMAAFNRLQEAKQSLVEVPKVYYPPDGSPPEKLAYIDQEEEQMLRDEGGSGEMTEYDVQSFQRGYADMTGTHSGKKETKAQRKQGMASTGTLKSRNQKDYFQNVDRWASRMQDYNKKPTNMGDQGRSGGYGGGGPSGGGSPMGSSHAQAVADRSGGSDDQADNQRRREQRQAQLAAERQAREQRAAAEDKRQQERHEQNQKWAGQREGFVGEYGDYKGQYKELGSQIGGYKDKFDTMAGEARAAGDKGATAMGAIGEGYKGITGDAIAAEAQKGQAGFEAGAEQAGGLQAGTQAIQGRQAGYEGQLAGMADKVASGEAGQSQAAMLQGQMEEQRMAGQKGSEEKLRREMAQSGASPAEIAAKVAQFQRQSAGQQAQASRSEALSSQLQGQQLGQQQMGAAAGLMGQALGATGQQLGAQAQLQSQGAQQAALRGQAAGMGMAGAQAQQQAQLASLQGQGQAVTQAAGLTSQGIQQQAGMMGQGIGVLQAQGGMVGQQAGMTQAQLNDVMAQQTQAYQEEQARQQRATDAAASSGGGGGGGGFLSNILPSDIRLKDNIQLLEEGKGGDPNIYSFNYKWDKDTKWRGVMAQELIGTKHSDAVTTNAEGFYMVDYTRLGFPMIKIQDKE